MEDRLDHRLHLNHHHAMVRRNAHHHDSSPNVQLPSPVAQPAPSKIFPRDDSAATSTCTDTTSPGCKLPEAASNSTSTIIGVSVAIPLALALIVLVLLHRRVKKRQAAEDALDAQADLDFGLGPKSKNANSTGKGRKGKNGPEMAATDAGFEKELRKGGHVTGMSIDLGNPYILPAEVNSSRDSLHSLTRSLTDQQDPYRMVGQKSPSMRGFNDNGSIKSGSDRGLLANPAPNPSSRSHSPLVPQAQQNGSSIQRKEVPGSTLSNEVVNMPTFDFTDHSATDARPGHASQASHGSASHQSVDVNAANRFSNPDKSLPATPHGDGLQTPPTRGDSLNKSAYGATNNAGPVDPYSFQEIVVPPSPDAESSQERRQHLDRNTENQDAPTFVHSPPPEPSNANRQTLGLGLDLAGDRLSVLRPLPPDDPNDTAESRANRIRSFYKEYFADDSAHAYDAGALDYYGDYGDEFLQDGTIFDPETGQFIVGQGSHADPITRRAMTPPPRGPPQKFRGGPRRPGHISQGSSPGLGPRGRAFSNASYSRNGPGFGPRGRPPGKRPLPPPSVLHSLPTPHLLKEDAFGMTMEFAPPTGYRDRAAGRADSPRMEDRPYSPQVPIAGSPLVSSYTELAAVPSPHLLRKSSTFTGLDFALPPKIKDRDGPASDAGSIKSGRSNFCAISARQQQNIRAGAYRLSRVPKELVGTKNDLMDSLKPQWKLGS